MTVVPSGDRSTFVYGQGDYGAEYAGDLVRIVEQGNCEVYESDEITAPLWPEPLGENP
jgi:hypothetical protein